jgi:hypothetical protein
LKVDRTAEGNVRYGWKRNTPPMSLDLQKKLVAAGNLEPDECLFHVRNVETGKPIQVHHGCVNWNPYRQRWVLITSEFAGTSILGEVWYAEAESPLGPWAYARKIVTHDKQSFYNPRHHPFLNQQDGRIVFFEGTYTHSFSGNHERTPRYEYNQIMYRMDLQDSRLVLPMAVYRMMTAQGERLAFGAGKEADPTFRNVDFFACDRSFPESIPVFVQQTDGGSRLSTAKPDGADAKPFCYAISADAESRPKACAPLFEHHGQDGKKRYAVGNDELPGFQRAARPVCYVWPSPTE